MCSFHLEKWYKKTSSVRWKVSQSYWGQIWTS